MRIVGGKLKGRTLVPFDGESIRPTSDKARESLFNILRDKVVGCDFCDLFAGTGAVGIEAYSRGAKYVALNDGSRNSIAVIKKNIEKIGTPSEIRVYNGDALTFLKTGGRFDVIFIDPPYKSDLGAKAIRAAFENGALKEGGIIVLETETPYADDYSENIYDTRKYGRARLTFFRAGDK